MNISLAAKVIEAAVSAGVREFCVCAGARNSPLVMVLDSAQGIQLYSFFEERSASFFALGRIQATNRPVAVVTTSGTAVAEMLPAAVEATYSGWPLLLITADRPRNYRGSGAPQTIEQVGIFSRYVETCWDVADLEDRLPMSSWSRRLPLQINVCFSEPLIDEEIPTLDVTSTETILPKPPPLKSQQRRTLTQPLILAGAIPVESRDLVIESLERLSAPIYAEGLSNLRGVKSLEHLLLSGGERSVHEIFQRGLCQSVLRVGGVPTVRFWRDLEDKYKNIPVVSVSETDYTGLSRPSYHYIDYLQLSLIESVWKEITRDQISQLDQAHASNLKEIMQRNSLSEVSLISKLAEKIVDQSVYLGNSLPVREWDLTADKSWSYHRITGHRGANGIDGQVSGFLGWANDQRENWCLVGDLTALYDLQALWVTGQMKEKYKLRIAVINNSGGQIFKNIFGKEVFLNRHSIDFSSWASMWKWPYYRWTEIPNAIDLPDQAIIEIVPDESQSNAFWRDYKN